MRICDRCFKKDGSATVATDSYRRETTDSISDLCTSCADKTSDFINKADPNKVKPVDENEKPSHAKIKEREELENQ